MKRFTKLTLKVAKQLFSYDPDTGVMTWRVSKYRVKRGDTVGHNDGKYLHTRIFGRLYKVHRIAWLLSFGEWPEDQIDHINGDGTDNRLCNLRVVSNSGNLRNAKVRSDNSTGIMGVNLTSRGDKWRARCSIDQQDRQIGVFDDFFEACCARKSAELKHGYHLNHGRYEQ